MNAQIKNKKYIPSKMIFEFVLLGEIWELMSLVFLLGKALESPSTKTYFYYQWLTKENGEERVMNYSRGEISNTCYECSKISKRKVASQI